MSGLPKVNFWKLLESHSNIDGTNKALKVFLLENRFQWNRDKSLTIECDCVCVSISWHAAISSYDGSHGPRYMSAVSAQWESEIRSIPSGIWSCRLFRLSVGHQQGDTATWLLCPRRRDPPVVRAARSMQCKCHCSIIFVLNAVMLVLGLGLKAKFCGLGFAIGWPCDCGLGLGLSGLALAKNSRPKSWRTTKFTINFHQLESIIFQDPRSLLTNSRHPWPFVIVQYLLHDWVILLISMYHVSDEWCY